MTYFVSFTYRYIETGFRVFDSDFIEIEAIRSPDDAWQVEQKIMGEDPYATRDFALLFFQKVDE